jgi:RNA-directed DNA polymerase
MPDGTKVSSEEGTPQGGPLSPLLSNIVLDELDWELDRRGLRFVRYADDCNIFVRSPRAGQRVMAATRQYIEKRLRLEVNESKSSVARPDEVHFLGFRFCRDTKGNYGPHLSARSHDRIRERIKEMTPRLWGRALNSCIQQLNVYLRGWCAYFRLCNVEGAELFRRLDAHIRRRLRAIIVAQKKRARHLYRHLRSRDISKTMAAGAAYCKRGTWNKSNRPGLTRAYPNDWFHQRLESLWARWEKFNPPPPPSSEDPQKTFAFY